MPLNHSGYKARLKAIYASMWNAADGNPWDEKRFADEMVDANQEYIESGDVQTGIIVQGGTISGDFLVDCATTTVGKMK